LLGATAGGQTVRVPTGHQHDGSGRVGQQVGLCWLQVGEGRGRVQRRHHHGERALLAVLARPQSCDRVLVGGIDGQVVAAQALDRHDLAIDQQRRCGVDRITGDGMPARGHQ
jgi:hypothetical protein